jgi:hypothetical protein
MTPAVQNRSDDYGVVLNGVIHGEWEPLGEGSMEILVNPAMNASENPQGFDV